MKADLRPTRRTSENQIRILEHHIGGLIEHLKARPELSDEAKEVVHRGILDFHAKLFSVLIGSEADGEE